MLIQFSIKNYRSIKDSAMINFAASKDKSLESYLLHPDEKRALLPAIAIYGANAAGKSNMLYALMTMKDMVVGDAAKISKGQKLPWEPFGDTTTPTSFEIVFIYQGVRYPCFPQNVLFALFKRMDITLTLSHDVPPFPQPVISARISLAKVTITPPASVRKPLLRWDGS